MNEKWHTERQMAEKKNPFMVNIIQVLRKRIIPDFLSKYGSVILASAPKHNEVLPNLEIESHFVIQSKSIMYMNPSQDERKFIEVTNIDDQENLMIFTLVNQPTLTFYSMNQEPIDLILKEINSPLFKSDGPVSLAKITRAFATGYRQFQFGVPKPGTSTFSAPIVNNN